MSEPIEWNGQKRKPFYALCAAEDCGWSWPVAYLPMNVDLFGKIGMNVRCPMCGGTKAFVAS